LLVGAVLTVVLGLFPSFFIDLARLALR